ncbi:MAG: hypothetical protein FWF35_01560 [Elusimicrobia bacterium]|nr:hypothetical protein [Elusimicrobiota bacterium]
METFTKYAVIFALVIIGLNVACGLRSDLIDRNIIKNFQAAQDRYYAQNHVYADSFKKLNFAFHRGEQSDDCEFDKKYQDCMDEIPPFPLNRITRIVYLDISDAKEGYSIIVNHGCDRYRYVGTQTKTDFKISKERY